MPIRLRCPQCSKEYQVADQYAGSQAKCKSCGATMSIPAAAAPPQAPVPTGGQNVYAQAPAGRNVYAQAAARGPLPPPLPVKRPASVTVIAILQIIFQSLALLGVLVGVAQLTGVWPQDEQTKMMYDDSLFRGWAIVSLPIGAIVATLWIVTCVGLLRMRPWARPTAIGLVVFGMVMQVAGMVMQIYIFKAGPLSELVKDSPHVVQLAMTMALVMVIVVAILGLGYGVLLLILLNRRVVVEAFRAAARRG
jgi:hypothetical protein